MVLEAVSHSSEVVGIGSEKRAMQHEATKIILDRLFGLEGASEDITKEWIEIRTHGKCRTISGFLAYRLETQREDLFEQAFVLTSDLTGDGFVVDIDVDSRSYFHSVCIAEGKSGVWYAMSPANFVRKEKPNKDPGEIYSAATLGDLLVTVRQREGGEWPDRDSILQKRQEFFDEKVWKEYAGRFGCKGHACDVYLSQSGVKQVCYILK